MVEEQEVLSQQSRQKLAEILGDPSVENKLADQVRKETVPTKTVIAEEKGDEGPSLRTILLVIVVVAVLIAGLVKGYFILLDQTKRFYQENLINAPATQNPQSSLEAEIKTIR